MNAPLGFPEQRWVEIKALAKDELTDWLNGSRECRWYGEDDFDLCFDTDEENPNEYSVYLYRVERGMTVTLQSHWMTPEDLGLKNATV